MALIDTVHISDKEVRMRCGSDGIFREPGFDVSEGQLFFVETFPAFIKIPLLIDPHVKQPLGSAVYAAGKSKGDELQGEFDICGIFRTEKIHTIGSFPGYGIREYDGR